MLLSALLSHRRRFDENPRRFVLHPALRAPLILEMADSRSHVAQSISHSMSQPDGSEKFCNVPIVWDSTAAVPKLINCRNVVEYL